MADLERPERLQIMLSADELMALENWRFENRMPSRAAAVRELLRRGLAAEGYLGASPGSRSRDFGVLGTPPNGDDGTNSATRRADGEAE
ncbi:hypothetical protein SAZ10_11380 [Mesorhizobium sp. BAC0120]|uniref:hypothetical protein n=1 Tax=Mesorhizobium sp. BAC0120 TaxID=3090670 RepID=UPI00298D1762|nr:hypothetical protein [Mesorhizobium sp. BAC0120]MDW6022355.1 hypothetical protein [Mesorhizobium sp. BAC0120]